MNDAELVIDDVSGFVRDHRYRRRYALDCFRIRSRKATPFERLEPFERYRRGAMKWLARRMPFECRSYLEQEALEFDPRLLALKINGTIYLDGLWQSERYFMDVEQIIRDDLQIVAPLDETNQRVAAELRRVTAVALHVRWFDAPGTGGIHNTSRDYYERAIEFVERNVASPHYFLFSDDPVAATAKLSLPRDRLTVLSHNRSDDTAYADLWLMAQCRHFVIANSTFSWWGAWLGGAEDKIVVCPGMALPSGTLTAWNFVGQLPDRWVRM